MVDVLILGESDGYIVLVRGVQYDFLNGLRISEVRVRILKYVDFKSSSIRLFVTSAP